MWVKGKYVWRMLVYFPFHECENLPQQLSFSLTFHLKLNHIKEGHLHLLMPHREEKHDNIDICSQQQLTYATFRTKISPSTAADR